MLVVIEKTGYSAFVPDRAASPPEIRRPKCCIHEAIVMGITSTATQYAAKVEVSSVHK